MQIALELHSKFDGFFKDNFELQTLNSNELKRYLER